MVLKKVAVSFTAEFSQLLYSRIRERVAPRTDQLRALRAIADNLRDMRWDGKFDARVYDDINVRKAYMLSYFPAAVAQAEKSLQMSIAGQPGAMEKFQENVAKRDLSLRITVIGAGPAPELLALVSLMKHTTKRIELTVVDRNANWGSAIDFTEELVKHEQIRAARDKPIIDVNRIWLNLDEKLSDKEVNDLGSGCHIVFAQNLLGELSNKQMAVDNLASIVSAMPTNASLLLSEQKFTKSTRSLQQFSQRVEQLQRDGVLVAAESSESEAKSPFAVPKEMTEEYFGKFDDSDKSKAFRNPKFKVYGLRKPMSSDPVTLPTAIDFD